MPEDQGKYEWYKLTSGDKTMIQFIVSNRIHAMASVKQVCREFFDREPVKKYHRNVRKQIYRVAINQHCDNRRLYDAIVTGDFFSKLEDV